MPQTDGTLLATPDKTVTNRDFLVSEHELIRTKIAMVGMEMQLDEATNELDDLKEICDGHERTNQVLVQKLNHVTQEYGIATQQLEVMYAKYVKRGDALRELLSMTYKQRADAKAMHVDNEARHATARDDKVQMMAALDDADRRLSGAMEDLSVTKNQLAVAKNQLLSYSGGASE